MFLKIARKECLIALSFFCFSCSSPCRQWQMDQAFSNCAAFKSVRLFLPNDDPYRGLQIELTLSSAETRLCFIAFSLPFPADEQFPEKTSVHIKINDQDYQILADRLEGDQSLLIPPDATQMIIHALLQGAALTIRAGRYETEVLPFNFVQLYEKLGGLEEPVFLPRS